MKDSNHSVVALLEFKEKGRTAAIRKEKVFLLCHKNKLLIFSAKMF